MTRVERGAHRHDVGGTFTDAASIDGDGRSFIGKLPTRTDDTAAGFAKAVSEVGERPATAAGDVPFLGHGTTTAANVELVKPVETCRERNEVSSDLLFGLGDPCGYGQPWAVWVACGRSARDATP